MTYIHHPVTDDTGTLVGVISQQTDGLWLASILPADRTQLITSTWQPLATEAEARERIHRHLAQRGPVCDDCGDTGWRPERGVSDLDERCTCAVRS